MVDLGLAQFLSDVSSELPCGENLEEDALFLKLEDESRFIPERQVGSSILPAEEPNWEEVKGLALELLKSTRDIQVAMYLTSALIRTDGFDGLNQGLSLMSGWLENYWDSVYPCQDPEDDYPMLRVNTLSSLNDYTLVISPIHKLPLIQSGIGNFSWRDFEMGEGKTLPIKDEVALEMSSVDAFFDDENNEEKKQDLMASLTNLLISLEQSLGYVRTISTVVTDKSGAVNAPNLFDITTLLQNIIKFVTEKLQRFQLAGKYSEVIDIEENSEELSRESGVTRKAAKKVGVHSRDDVVQAIEAICQYFDHYEPSSPVPFLLLRAKKLVTMNFMDILREMTPDGVNQAENICGVEENQDD